jgi:hypothetical protein
VADEVYFMSWVHSSAEAELNCIRLARGLNRKDKWITIVTRLTSHLAECQGTLRVGCEMDDSWIDACYQVWTAIPSTLTVAGLQQHQDRNDMDCAYPLCNG